MRYYNIFRKKNILDEYGYCIHLPTGPYPLYDMCEHCADCREEQWDYKFIVFLNKLPKGLMLSMWFVKLFYWNGRKFDDE